MFSLKERDYFQTNIKWCKQAFVSRKESKYINNEKDRAFLCTAVTQMKEQMNKVAWNLRGIVFLSDEVKLLVLCCN